MPSLLCILIYSITFLVLYMCLVVIPLFNMIKVIRHFLGINVSAVLLYFVTNFSIHICFTRDILFRAFIVHRI